MPAVWLLVKPWLSVGLTRFALWHLADFLLTADQDWQAAKEAATDCDRRIGYAFFGNPACKKAEPLAQKRDTVGATLILLKSGLTNASHCEL